MNFQKEIKLINENLTKNIPGEDILNKKIIKAVKYSLLSNGKKIRAIILLKFYSILSGYNIGRAVNFACALEMVHTYSLIHDDLPCMDNSDYRRGKLSNHKVFGEDFAVLSGDALLNLAFEIIFSEENLKYFDEKTVLKAASILAKYSGISGMLGGQSIDLESKGENIDLKTLEKMYHMKTACLFIAAAEIGCLLAGFSESQIFYAKEYAKNLGLAFQISDDITDYMQDEESHCIKILGIERSKELVKELTEKAIKNLKYFQQDMSFFRKFALILKNN
jgi:geranylgeranyl diphosphate synthase type II